MSPAFWIAVGAATLVIVAHVALFMIFMRDPKKRRNPEDGD